MHFLCCKCVSITTRTSVFMGEKGILMGFSSAIYVFLFYLFFTYYVLLIFTYYVLLIFYLCFTYFLFILIILTYSYSYYFLRIFYLFLRLILSFKRYSSRFVISVFPLYTIFCPESQKPQTMRAYPKSGNILAEERPKQNMFIYLRKNPRRDRWCPSARRRGDGGGGGGKRGGVTKTGRGGRRGKDN